MFMLRFWISVISVVSLFLISCSFPAHIIRDEPLRDAPREHNYASESGISAPSEVENHALGGESPEDDTRTKRENSDGSVQESDSSGEAEKNSDNQQRLAQEQENMDEALELLAQSQNQWEKGELEDAIGLLDQAYSLILDVDGEPDIAWQKDDLRFMIAKRILEIYTSRSKVAIGLQGEIPLIVNDDVKKEIRRYQRGERNFFIESYKRSGMYRPFIVQLMREAGLPEELSWLPLIESGFKVKALSSARALGLWQIIPSTGYKFGLKRDHWVDERMDIEKSTKAAIAYLKELHGIFGDWMTVLAAYNCGEGRVLRVISRQHMNYLDNFWDLYRQLPIETAQYVPRFLAALHIIQQPEKYGFTLGQDMAKPIDYEIITTFKCMKLDDIARYLEVPLGDLTALNSELRFKTTPDKEYKLNVPRGSAERFALVVAKIPQSKIPGSARYVRHKIKKGEALSTIARKYHTSVQSIARANHLNSRHVIRAGKWLKIPLRGYTHVDQKSAKRTPPVVTASKGNIITCKVKKGNSIWLLARRYNTTVSEIKRINNLHNDRLQVGQVLKIRNGTAPNAYIVKKGDCLVSIADSYNMSVHELMTLNHLSREDTIYPGQVITVSR
jgi:membrane-bound lytic murein transglycosylase D